MKTAVSFSTALLMLTGCANSTNQIDSSQFFDTTYHCDHGKPIQVRFFPEQEKATLFRDNEAIELRQKPAGSGYLYSNGSISIRGKGNELSLLIEMMPPINCIAQ